jgi:hypothetical protein
MLLAGKGFNAVRLVLHTVVNRDMPSSTRD